MDLNDILLFTKLVESKTLTSAADALGIPKSTVSRRLSLLEATLGVTLFERNTRHFTLTDVGMAYYVRCSEIVRNIFAANQYVTDLQVSPRGRVRMAAPTDLSSRYLGGILGEFAKAHPEINIELQVTDRVVSIAEEGFDVALRIATPSTAQTSTAKMSVTPVAKMSGILCASPEYLEKHGAPASTEDLYTHALLVFMPEGMHSLTITDGNANVEIAPPARMVTNYYAPIRDALLAGAGIGLMCDYSVAEELASGTLVRVLPSWFISPVDISIVYAHRDAVPPRIRLLVEHLTKSLSPAPWQAYLDAATRLAESPSVEQLKGRAKRVSRTDADGDRRAATR